MYGIEYTDIVDYYLGSDLTDYSTSRTTSASIEVIESEIEMVAEEILGYMSKNTQVLFYHLKGVQLKGCSSTVFDLPFPGIENCDMVIRGSATDCKCCLATYRSNGYQYQLDCHEPLECLDVLSYSVSGGQIILDAPWSGDVWASYDLDPDQLVLTSFKKALRDGVACSLGSRLYSDGMNEWKLVERACEAYDKYLEKITNSKYIPPEFLRLNYWDPIQYTGIYTIKMKRG